MAGREERQPRQADVLEYPNAEPDGTTGLPWWAASPNQIRPEDLEKIHRSIHRAVAILGDTTTTVSAILEAAAA